MAGKKKPVKVVRKRPTSAPKPPPVAEADVQGVRAFVEATGLAGDESGMRPARQRPRLPIGRKGILTSPHLKDLAQQMTDEFCAFIRQGDFTTTACTRAGLNPGTVSYWVRKGQKAFDEGRPEDPHAVFMMQVREAEAERQSMLVSCVVEAAQWADPKTGDPKHWNAATWLLERQDPKQFGVRIQLHVEQELGAALDRLKAALTPDEYEKALTAIVSGDGAAAPEGGAPTEATDEAEADAAAVDTSDESEVPAAEAPEAADGQD